jgi:hypothetical protein
MDAERYPLKTKNLILCPLDMEKAHEEYVWLPMEGKRIKGEYDLYEVHAVGGMYREYAGKMAFVDPAGGRGKDEISVTGSAHMSGYIFILDQENWHGYNTGIFREIAEFIVKMGVRLVVVEENMDRGSFGVLLQGEFKELGVTVRVENFWETRNKEARMIGTLEPIMGRHKLVVNSEIVESDKRSLEKYAVEEREMYSLWFQMMNATMDKGGLVVDDRLDSLTGAVGWWLDKLKKGIKGNQEENIMKMIDEKIGAVKDRTAGRLKKLWGGNYGGGR